MQRCYFGLRSDGEEPPRDEKGMRLPDSEMREKPRARCAKLLIDAGCISVR